MKRLYRRWIVANTWSEGAGLGTTFVLGWLIGPHIEGRGPFPIIVSGLAAVVVGVILEGVLVGYAQERVLRGTLSRLTRGRWVVATAIGAQVAWLIGMVPSTVMALGASLHEGPAWMEPSAAARYLLAVGLGLVTGPILGAAQGIVLRGLVPGAWKWLIANAIAWSVGMPLIFIGMDHVPWGGAPLPIVVSLYLVCGVTGAVVGAISGWLLVDLCRLSPVTTGGALPEPARSNRGHAPAGNRAAAARAANSVRVG